jgi:hemerythrin-like metal-binding protein
METGNELIDRHHREIVHLLGELSRVYMAPEREVLRVLDGLMDFTLDHFLAEEALMREVRYPPSPAAAMIHSHAEFTDYARLRVLEFRMGNTASVLPLHGFLFDWLIHHEFGMDRLLANWIRDHHDAPAAGA